MVHAATATAASEASRRAVGVRGRANRSCRTLIYGVTVMVALEPDVTPSNTAVALIEATPGAFGVTNPLASTVATAGLLEAHTIVRPVTVALEASLHVAVS